MKRLAIWSALLPVFVLLYGCAGTGKSAEVHDVRGVMQVQLDVFKNSEADNLSQGGPCITDSGYDDMKAGVDVTVYGKDGSIIGMGSLTQPRLGLPSDGDKSLLNAYCELVFVVPDVPTGQGYYSISVGHRGKVNFTEEQIFKTPTLTLGEVPS